MAMSMHEAVLQDGNPEVYKKWVSHYEEDSMKLGYVGHKSVVSKWTNYYNIPHTNGCSNHSTTTNGTITPLFKIFDAGCGTGFIGDELAHLIANSTVELYGGDLSPDMLDIAESKILYKELKIVNLNETIPYPSDTFDSILSAGVFLQGHCGPECLSNLVRVLKQGGYIIGTVRDQFYKETKEEWKREISLANCELIEDNYMPYRPDVQAVMIVIKKR